MYNVLIADDEIAVRKGLRLLINWEQLGFCIIGEAENGADALQFIERHPTDLVLSDIRMPVMDGLRFVEKLKSRNLNRYIRVILISAYKDFDYVQNAIQIGVIEYILKPINEGKLIATLQKVKKEMDDENSYYDDMARSLSLSQGTIFSSFYMDRSHQFLLQKALQYENGRTAVGFCIGIVFPREPGVMAPETGRHVQELLSRYEWGYCIAKEATVTILFCMAERSWPALKYMTRCMYDSLRFETGTRCMLSAGSMVSFSRDVHISYEQAKSQLGSECPAGGLGIIYCEEQDYKKQTEQYFGKIIDAVSEKNIERACNFIDAIILNQLADSDHDKGLHELCMQLFCRFIDLLHENGTEASGIFNAEIISQISSFGEPAEYADILKQTCAQVIYAMQSPSAQDNTEVIMNIKNYIYKNCAQDIKLKEIAKNYSFNIEYLGRLFKSVTGMNFVDYHNYCRVEKAETLLLKGNMKNYEVSTSVGYHDINYFYRIFKRFKGYSPGDCKKGRGDGQREARVESD